MVLSSSVCSSSISHAFRLASLDSESFFWYVLLVDVDISNYLLAVVNCDLTISCLQSSKGNGLRKRETGGSSGKATRKKIKINREQSYSVLKVVKKINKS
jgi:hypothetical protein